MGEEGVAAAEEGGQLGGVEAGAEGGAAVVGVGEAVAEAAHIGEPVVGETGAGVVPDDGAELLMGVEAEAVVDAPEVFVGGAEDVAALAVGVVGDEVEGSDADQLVVEAIGFAQVDVVLGGVVLDEELHGALAVGAVAADGGGDEVPAEEAGAFVGGDFAEVEGAVGEVVEGAFALLGLVDAEAGAELGVEEVGEEDVVG